MDILDDLQYRGLVYQVSNLEELKKALKKGRLVLYCGFDPTADSLQVGNLVPLLTFKDFRSKTSNNCFNRRWHWFNW